MSWGPFSLEGKHAVVTGGAQGIGFGIVRRFVEAGADVVISDLDGDLAEKKAASLAGPGEAVGMAADVADIAAGDQMVARAIEAFGSVDILVNNAGIYPQVPMLDMTVELWDRVQDINLRGLAFVSKAFAAEMAKQGAGGKIVNIASIDGLHPSMVGLAAYDASKGGVVMFTRNLALELAPHRINVNAIAPGGISTEGTAAPLEGSGLSEAEMEAMMQQFTARIPMGRIGDPDDIAKAAVFMASSAADYMTGEIMVVDGGMLLT